MKTQKQLKKVAPVKKVKKVKKVAPVKKVKKVKKVAPVTVSEPTLVSYSIKMVIPTGNYANIQPEIVVKAGTIEEAHSFIAPHMNKLWKEYYLISERKAEVKTPAPAPVKAEVKTPAPVKAEVVTAPPVVEQPSPIADVALTKAIQFIEGCMSVEALDLVIKQVAASVKLTDENKKDLLPILEKKSKELHK